MSTKTRHLCFGDSPIEKKRQGYKLGFTKHADASKLR